MHSHILAIGPSRVNTYTARALEKSDAAQRAADVRKKLMAPLDEIAVEADSADDWMVSRGYEEASRKGSRQPARGAKEASHVGEAGEFVEPLSVWA